MNAQKDVLWIYGSMLTSVLCFATDADDFGWLMTSNEEASSWCL